MLLFLSLLAVASASPLHLLNQQYGYSPYYGQYNGYTGLQYRHHYPMQYPVQYPQYYQTVHNTDPELLQRGLFTSEIFRQETATLSAADAVVGVTAVTAVAASATGVTPVVAAVAAVDAVLAASAKTLTGTIQLNQNPLLFGRVTYKIYLAEAKASTKYIVGVATACDDAAAAAGTELAEITSPLLLVNGVWIGGHTNKYKLGGDGTPIDITGMVVTVKEGTSVIGCSAAIA